MKVVKIFSKETDAELARAHLDSAGIEAFVLKDDCGGMEPMLQLTNGVRLVVRDGDLKEAVRILDQGTASS